MSRLVDGPSVERERLIRAAPEEVWPHCVDFPGFARWSPEHLGGEWLPPETGAAVGARYRGGNRGPSGEVTSTVSTVTVLRPPEEVTWAVGPVDEPAATWSFLLDPVDGGTRLLQRVVLGVGASPLTEAIERWPEKEERIIARRCEVLAANIDAVLAGLSALFEGEDARG